MAQGIRLDQGDLDAIYTNLTVQDLTVEGTQTIKTTESVTGDTTLGDEASDNLTINATLASSFKLGGFDLTNGGRIEADQVDLINAGNGTNPTLTSNDTAQRLTLTGGLDVTSGLTADGAATFNDSGNSVDLRVESTNETNMLLVSGAQDQVNIHTNFNADWGALNVGARNASNGTEVDMVATLGDSQDSADVNGNNQDAWGVRIGNPTLNSVSGATTITDSAALYVPGPLQAGTDLTITNQYVALFEDGGGNKLFRFTSGGDLDIASGNLAINGPSAINFNLHQAGGNYAHLGAPASGPTTGDMDNGSVIFWLDETNDELEIQAKYSDGTTKSGTVALS